ncbi:unnamed protein product [Bursaphelenchus xylophilus]|uniref:(pine wood nematode) hypothetical protein n=1 Tax=Bursaphelenchus xylophilus TaxID=6326 RepID=A0A1I7SDN6_BURXY|nr:unnamed protein product [Bursaphelenchus xylophilus]CAG9120923.1 unnamed protein product [Bursaphelenchus xylophilus]
MRSLLLLILSITVALAAPPTTHKPGRPTTTYKPHNSEVNELVEEGLHKNITRKPRPPSTTQKPYTVHAEDLVDDDLHRNATRSPRPTTQKPHNLTAAEHELAFPGSIRMPPCDIYCTGGLDVRECCRTHGLKTGHCHWWSGAWCD